MAVHVPVAHHDDEDAHKARIKTYVVVAIVLAIFTAMEVATFYLPDIFKKDGPLLVPTLMLLMVVKFWIVAWYFMHLKFDKRLLTVVFYSGLALALAVYIAVLTVFRFWGPPSDHMVSH